MFCTYAVHVCSKGYGYARRATSIHTGEEVAVKVVNKAAFATHTANSLDMFHREMQIISSISHPGIIEGKGIYEDDIENNLSRDALSKGYVWS